jgi:iodotyrosine deiodinase|tara:strand:- start:215 stop:880 length:666 start_codon:yes stop_codon:yes gene_type:complete
MNNSDFIPFKPLNYSENETHTWSAVNYEFMNKRRSVREFSDRPVHKSVIENILKAAATAPSGANQQPWTFCAISNPKIKSEIRKAAEEEEFENYHGRMSERWVKELEKFGTDHIKPFLEIAPWLIVVFKQTYGLENGKKQQHYYVNESVGLATGMLISAIHHAGLVALTHTPSPLSFLSKILKRPENEKPFLLIPIGYPKKDVAVPNIKRKALNNVSVWFE